MEVKEESKQSIWHLLVEACRDKTRTVLTRHVNHVLVQPHWRSHEDLIKQQVVS